MSVDAAAILRQTPRFVTRPMTSPFGLQFEEVASAVRAALPDVAWRGGDPDSLRLIAYARDSGAFSEDETTARMLGSDEELAADVLTTIQQAHSVPFSGLPELVRSVIVGNGGNELRAADAFEGWAISLLELVAAVRPVVLGALLVRDDQARLVLRWLLGLWLTNDERVKFAATLMQDCDDLASTAAAALLVEAARSHVERGDPAPRVPPAEASRRLETLGVVLTETFQFSGRIRLIDEQRARWEALVVSLRDEVAMSATTATDARLLRSRVGEDDTSLVALIGRVARGGAAVEFGREGDGLLRRYFRPLMRRERDVAADGLPYLAPIVVNSLTQIWVDLRADAGFFDELRSGLRYGEFSHAFTYGQYLVDRPRAMILAAIAAVAAVSATPIDEPLLQGARTLALSLHGMPAAVSPPFDQAAINSLRERTGIDLPLDQFPDVG